MNISDLLQVLKKRWLLLLSVVVFSTILGVLYAFALPNLYVSEALLAPVESQSSTGGFPGKIGGLAEIAGIEIESGTDSKVLVAVEILKSRKFLSSFIKNHDLKVRLLAAESYDSEVGQLIIDPNIYNSEKGTWLDDGEEVVEPSDYKAINALLKKIRIHSDENGFYRLSVTSLSPILAQEIVENLIVDVNEQIRKRDIEKAEKSIRFLRERIGETALAAMHSVFYQLIEQQTKAIMLANVTQEYVFQVLDPAIIPEDRSYPKRKLILVISVLLGVVLGLFGVVAFHFIIEKERVS